MTRPPTTAVRRVDFLRQRETKSGDKRYDIAKFVAPIQTRNKKMVQNVEVITYITKKGATAYT